MYPTAFSYATSMNPNKTRRDHRTRLIFDTSVFRLVLSQNRQNRRCVIETGLERDPADGHGHHHRNVPGTDQCAGQFEIDGVYSRLDRNCTGSDTRTEDSRIAKTYRNFRVGRIFHTRNVEPYNARHKQVTPPFNRLDSKRFSRKYRVRRVKCL